MLDSYSSGRNHEPGASMTVSCDSPLQMRLQKINVFIGGANDLGEHVRGSIISQRGALLDRLARSVCDIRKMVQQSADVVHAVHDVQIVFFDAGVRCNLSSGAIRASSEGGNTLGDQVNRLFYMLSYGIEQQMQLIEIFALDVPVREVACVCRSIVSAKRAFRRSTSGRRLFSGTPTLLSNCLSSLLAPGCANTLLLLRLGIVFPPCSMMCAALRTAGQHYAARFWAGVFLCKCR